jgi:hypothetical protein
MAAPPDEKGMFKVGLAPIIGLWQPWNFRHCPMVNLQTARALEVEIPSGILSIADEVVE